MYNTITLSSNCEYLSVSWRKNSEGGTFFSASFSAFTYPVQIWNKVLYIISIGSISVKNKQLSTINFNRPIYSWTADVGSNFLPLRYQSMDKESMRWIYVWLIRIWQYRNCASITLHDQQCIELIHKGCLWRGRGRTESNVDKVEKGGTVWLYVVYTFVVGQPNWFCQFRNPAFDTI